MLWHATTNLLLFMLYRPSAKDVIIWHCFECKIPSKDESMVDACSVIILTIIEDRKIGLNCWWCCTKKNSTSQAITTKVLELFKSSSSNKFQSLVEWSASSRGINSSNFIEKAVVFEFQFCEEESLWNIVYAIILSHRPQLLIVKEV